MRIKTCRQRWNTHIISMLAMLLCLWTNAHGQGSPWIVDADGNGDFTSIQDAIDIAQNGDSIYVIPGTYYGTGSLAEPVVDMRGKSLHLQRYPGETGTVYVDGNNKRRCLACASGEDLSTVIESIEFRNGYAEWGGGLYCMSSSPTLKDCVFDNNNSTDRGGAVYIEAGNPSLENCVVTNNTSPYGGGFYIRESYASISGGLVAGNQSTARGGGFRIYDASPNIYDVQIESNWSSRGGAAHIQQNSAPTFQNCLIRQNTADSLGGGMAHSSNSQRSIRTARSSKMRRLATTAGRAVAVADVEQVDGAKHCRARESTGALAHGLPRLVLWLLASRSCETHRGV